MRTLITTINIVFGLIGLAWPVAAFTTIFLFDAPGSTENQITNNIAFSINSYPVFYIIALIGSIISYKKGLEKRALLFSLLPLVNFVWFAVSVILLEIL